jgi:hypothetical protein
MQNPTSGADAPLIHVGYHKTASSWLQSALFEDACTGFHAVPRPEILDRLVLVPPFEFDPATAREGFAGALAGARSRSAVPVLSHERLSGNPHSGGYDAALLADRVAAVFPDARVLIVIREQRSMIVSVYKQYVAEGGPASLRRYLHPPCAGRARLPMFRFGFFEYDRMIARYQALFARERVLVLAFEELKRAPRDFVERVAAFAGTAKPGELRWEAANVGLSALATALKRPLNLVLVRDRLNPLGWSERGGVQTLLRRGVEAVDGIAPGFLRDALERRLRERVEGEVGHRYRESNRRICELTGLDLAAYGYDL